MSKQNLILGDCMEFMADVPDKYYDLAIVDPPYGIGMDWRKRKRTASKFIWKYDNKQIPNKYYFDELRRVSKNWIIWGWNYYTSILEPTNYLICWDKKFSEETSFSSMFELAGTSIKIPANIFRYSWDGARKEDEAGIVKIHPHQKPIALYKWLLTNYAKPGQKIFDSHGGSFSHAIAAYDLGFDLYIIELDEEYFNAGKARFDAHVRKCEEIKQLGFAKTELSKVNPTLF